MTTHVPDEGKRSAKLVLIGEAPGTREMSQRRPFVGPSGRLLAEWWAAVGLKRSDFYITNVLPYQPRAIDKVPVEEMQQHIRALHDRLSKLEDPWLIVPTGNYALYALTGKGRVSWHDRDGRHPRPGITSWRGSIMEYGPNGARGVKVIPTIHPAATFTRQGKGGAPRGRAAQYTRACIADWQRIATDRHFRGLALPQREHYIKPTLSDVRDFVADAKRHAEFLSIDIETPRTKVVEEMGVYKSGKKKGQPKTRERYAHARIGCIGFSYDPKWSLTIPTTWDKPSEYWGYHEGGFRQLRACIGELFQLPAHKVLQNGFFDTYWLRHEGYPPLAEWWWDTRCMHHALDATAPHDLAYLVSIYTREPYFKSEAKDPDEIMQWAHNDEALWTYNGKDVCTTLEVFYRLLDELDRQGMREFYLRHYGEMLEPLLETSLHGIRVDTAAQGGQSKTIGERAAAAHRRLEEAAGQDLMGKTAVSGDKLKAYLYEELRLPKQYAKRADGTKTVSTNEVALKKLAERFPDKAGPVVRAVLEHRAALKQAEFMDESKVDPDGRLRCAYSLCTAAGRLASQANPLGTGRNAQNIQRGETRGVFLPD